MKSVEIFLLYMEYKSMRQEFDIPIRLDFKDFREALTLYHLAKVAQATR